MVQSIMNLTTLPLSFWYYALESATRILNMVPTKKVDKTPYETVGMDKVPNFLIKRSGDVRLCEEDTPDKTRQDLLSCYFIEVEGFETPQEEVIPIRSVRMDAPSCSKNRFMVLMLEVEEHSLGWIDAMIAIYQFNLMWTIWYGSWSIFSPGCRGTLDLARTKVMVVVLWGCRWRWCEGGGGSGGDDEDGVGGVVMKVR
ncbi:hypothetical protein Tco_0505124 [Tanacetum coccineum]